MAHRVLRVLVRQETSRKVGFTLAREEEQLLSQLESVAAELATPTQFRGKLLTKYIALLTNHSGVLTNHSAVLTNHSAVLTNHSAVLTNHIDIDQSY